MAKKTKVPMKTAKKAVKRKVARKTAKKAARKVPNGPPNSYSYVNRALRCALREMGRDPDEAAVILDRVYHAFRNAIGDGCATTIYHYDASGNLTSVVDPQKHKAGLID